MLPLMLKGRTLLPPLSRTGALLFAGALLLTLLPAPGARADDVEASIQRTASEGKRPAFVLKVNKDLSRATLELRSAKGSHRKSLGPAKSGSTLTFELPHKEVGKRDWSGELAVQFNDGGSGTMPLRFSTEVVPTMRFEVVNDQNDIREHQRIVLKASGTVTKVDVEVYGEDDVLIASQSVPFDKAPAGTPLTVDWVPGKAGPVLRIQASVHDDKGFHSTGQFFPWTISVPHEEVVFDTGKWEVRASEEAKLRDALQKIRVEVKRYAKGVSVHGSEIRLYVSGFTDTVGDRSSNRTLSQRRARAIGEWFKRQGVGVPVYVRGFGEDVLKVETPDETDEVRNRRADYDIGVNSPTGSLAGWSRL